MERLSEIKNNTKKRGYCKSIRKKWDIANLSEKKGILQIYQKKRGYCKSIRKKWNMQGYHKSKIPQNNENTQGKSKDIRKHYYTEKLGWPEPNPHECL